VITKTRCGAWNKSKIRDFASGKYRLELDFIGYRPHSSRMKILAASMALTLFLLTSRGVSVAIQVLTALKRGFDG
jgi:hypothetical protein